MKKTRSTAAFLLICVLIAPVLLAACGAAITGTIDDATISTRVKTALLNDPQVGALHIDVDTFKGVVTLSGTVKSPAEEQQAVVVAKRINGVRDVKSTLKVQQLPHMPVAW
jgi:BON domain-containing protein